MRLRAVTCDPLKYFEQKMLDGMVVMIDVGVMNSNYLPFLCFIQNKNRRKECCKRNLFLFV